MDAKEILIKCERRLERGYLRLIFYSFVGNFESVSKYIPFNKLDCGEVEIFVAVCENRRERARILSNEIAPLIGFDVLAMTVVATIVSTSSNIGECGYGLLNEIVYTSLYGYLLIFLFAGFILLFVMLAHYRVQVHAWTVFKERGILQKSPTENQASCYASPRAAGDKPAHTGTLPDDDPKRASQARSVFLFLITTQVC